MLIHGIWGYNYHYEFPLKGMRLPPLMGVMIQHSTMAHVKHDLRVAPEKNRSHWILPATDPQMEVLSWNVDVHAASGKIHSLIVFMTNVSWFLRPDFPPDSSPQSASSLPLDRSLVAVCCIMLQKRLRLQCFQILLPRKTPAIFLKHIEIHLAVWMSFMGPRACWGSTGGQPLFTCTSSPAQP